MKALVLSAIAALGLLASAGTASAQYPYRGGYGGGYGGGYPHGNHYHGGYGRPYPGGYPGYGAYYPGYYRPPVLVAPPVYAPPLIAPGYGYYQPYTPGFSFNLNFAR